MASVSGSQLAFVSPNHKPVNLILSDGTNVTGATVAGAFNIEIFTTAPGAPLPGVDATALIEGAVKISDSEVQAGTLASVEQLGSGAYTVIDETRHSGSHHQAPQGERIELGTGAQTVIGSSGDTVIGGNAGTGQQVIDLTGTNHLVTSGPMTAIGGAGSLLVEAGNHDSIGGGSGSLVVDAGSFDTITGGSGPTTIFGGGPLGQGSGRPRAGSGGDDDDRGGDDDDRGGRGHGHRHRGSDDDHRRGHGRGHDDDDDRDHRGGHGRGHDDQGSGGFGHNTVIGGSGPMTVFGGKDDSIVGGSGSLTVHENPGASGSGETIVGGSGDLIVHGAGRGESITGGSGTNFIDDDTTGGHSTILGGTGTVTGAGGQAVNTLVVTDKGDSVAGSTGSLSVEGGAGHATVSAGTGGTTVDGGNRDVINNFGNGALLVDIFSQRNTQAGSSVPGAGMETVNLGAGHGATTLRDVSVGGGTGPFAQTSVMGFSATGDTVASATSVDGTGQFIGTSHVAGSSTILTFKDGSTMTLAGITDLTGIKFTQ